MFGTLQVWIDTNHDGITQAGELNSIAAVGVKSIGVIPKESEKRDPFGNLYRYRAPMVVENEGRQSVRYA